MKLSKIGAIVVNYNNPCDTRETLESLLKFEKQKGYRLTIYLVNNGCTDSESPELIKEYPQTVVINSSNNLGFAGGNNLGIKKALHDDCSHLLLINNDATIITERFFEKILKSGFDITAPLIEYLQNGKIVHDYGGKIDYLFGRNTHLLSPGKADYFTGACLFIDSKVLKKIKGFNDAFFLYYEDVDFCLRAQKAGYSLGLLPSVKVFHRLSASANKLGAKKIKILAHSHYLFCLRHLPIFSFPLYALFNLYLNSKRIPSYLASLRDNLSKSAYPYLNKLYCQLFNTPELHLVGDSHVWTYELIHPFIIHHLGAATAYNLGNPKSSTHSYQKLQSALKEIDKQKAIVIFELGEIDCRLHIYNQYRKNIQKKTIKNIILETIQRYLSIVEDIRSRGYRVALLSPTPTGIEGNVYRKGFFADFKKRDQIARTFHKLLQKEAKKRNIVYLDLYSKVVSRSGGIKSKYRLDEVHLNKLVAPITLRLLKKEKLYKL